MGTENVCGALTASLMVLGCLFVKEHAHQSPEIKEISKELFEAYNKKMGSYICTPLKEKYRSEEKKCYEVILKGAEILDEIIEKEMRKREKQ